MMIFKTAAILLVAATLAGCAPAPITPEVTYDKLGNPVYSDAS